MTDPAPLIFADFNRRTMDDHGDRIRLGKAGSQQVEKYSSLGWLVPGREVFIHDGELRVRAILEFDETTGFWYARPDWSTRRDLMTPAEALEEYRGASPGVRLAILNLELEPMLRAISGGSDLLKRISEETFPREKEPAILENLIVTCQTALQVLLTLTEDEDALRP